jgi:protein transport protein SEC13
VRIWTSSDLRMYSTYSKTIVVLIVSGDWKSTVLNVDAAAWRVSWSLSGNVLAVSTGDNRVSLWKERLSGGWDCVKTIEE